MYEPHLTASEQQEFELEIQWSAILLAHQHRREIRIELGTGYECDCQICRTVWNVIDTIQGVAMKEPEQRQLGHQCGVNASGEPFVQIVMDDKIICQMTSRQAREHAQCMLEAAESAEQDAFMVRFAQDQLHLSLPAAAQLLIEFRKQRASTGKSQGPMSLDEWTAGSTEPS